MMQEVNEFLRESLSLSGPEDTQAWTSKVEHFMSANCGATLEAEFVTQPDLDGKRKTLKRCQQMLEERAESHLQRD
jgi:hypothetical protein